MPVLKSRRTRSQMLAKVLEKEIFRGTFPPDSVLPGTREIAQRFDVSQRVVLCALDLLEKKDLVLRQERKRVYVKAHAPHPGAKELLFFAFGDEVGLDSIYQAVNELILRSGRDRKYDFFSRIVSTGDTWDHARLDRELARLENLGFIDCAIFYCSLDEEGMRKCMDTLPYPVIFLGEKPESDTLPKGARMISPNSADLPLTAARYAIEEDFRHLIFVYRENTALRRYEKAAMKRLQEFIGTHEDLSCSYVPVPGKNHKEVRENFKKMIPSLEKELKKGTLLAVHNIHCEEFENGQLIDPGKYPHSGLLTLDLPTDKSKCSILNVKRDLGAFQKELLYMVDHISEKVPSFQHRVADYQFTVIKQDPK